MSQSSGRKSRVEHALRETLTEFIAADVKDPRVRAATMLTVTKVEMNVDMAVANVFISVVGDEATADGVIAGLNKAAGFLRGPVGRHLGLQRAPELRFHLDVGIDVSSKLAQILREDEEKARAAGRTPGSDGVELPREEPAPEEATPAREENDS
ncbi:MAG TPA: 30S ribosome-binding factor RbfA [Kofleriaceae bacterium]|nr:30S ribosome-binding factor RbfA [Kofleriaceae bacterium]